MEKTRLLTILCIGLIVTAVAAFSTRAVFLFPQYWRLQETKHYTLGEGVFPTYVKIEAHSTIKQYRWIDGVPYLIYSYGHPAVLCNIGKNYTAMKISGNAAWPFNDEALYNVTFIALGHDVGLSAASTELPGEWNRTAGSFEYLGVGNWNYSASFFPSGSGTTNSTSLNWKTGIGTDDSMWAYDTFSTISYTDADQIDVEWEVTVTYS